MTKCMCQTRLSLDSLSVISINFDVSMQPNSGQVIPMTSMETSKELVIADEVRIDTLTITERNEVRMSSCFHYFNVYTKSY